MDNYRIFECEKGHRFKVYEGDPVPAECIICIHIEKLKKEQHESGNY